MKKLLLKNYWMMTVSWILFLNSNSKFAIILSVICSLYLFIKKTNKNYWRMFGLFLVFYLALSNLLTRSNISFFFSDSLLFVLAISLNTSVINEYSICLKKDDLLNILFMISSIFIIFSTILMIIPAYNYSLISKSSIFILILFIFSSYIFSLVYDYLNLKLLNS